MNYDDTNYDGGELGPSIFSGVVGGFGSLRQTQHRLFFIVIVCTLFLVLEGG